MRESCFVPRANDAKYHDFSAAITEKRAIAPYVGTFKGVIERQQRFMRQVEAWWQESLTLIEALAPDPGNHSELMGNVYALRGALLNSIGVAPGRPNPVNRLPGARRFCQFHQPAESRFKIDCRHRLGAGTGVIKSAGIS